MKVLEVLNSTLKNDKTAKIVSMNSIVLPPVVYSENGTRIIFALVAIPVLASLQSEKFKVNHPYKALRWEYESGNFLDCSDLSLKREIIELDLSYPSYVKSYLKLCHELDDNPEFDSLEFLRLIFPEKILELYKI